MSVDADLTIEKLLAARAVLAANELPENEPMWMVDGLSCGHLVVLPVNMPDKHPHLANSEEPLEECCFEAMRNKWLKESA
jgi:hypothetical protein